MRSRICLTAAFCIPLIAACASSSMNAEGSASRDPGAANNSSPNAGGGSGSDGASCCRGPSDCPTSYTCEQCACKPPEKETDRTTSNLPPAASPHYVYALNPAADSVARIDPATLSIEAIAVGSGPVDLAAMSQEDAAVVLSHGDGSLSIIDSNTLPSKILRIPLKRQLDKATLSADGAFAVLWPDPAKPPANGAEGIVTVVDIKAARRGASADKVRFERAVGYRVTNVLFRLDGGIATRALAVAKDAITIIDLTTLSTSQLPPRIALPASMAADVAAREVVATPDGAHVVLRSTVGPELAYFDGSSSSIKVVQLAEAATDLDMLPDGSAAVAALRAANQLAFIRIPQDLLDPTGIQTFDAGGASVGQVVLPPVIPSTGNFALVYTNASNEKSFARIDLPSGLVTRFALQKLVDEIDLSPDGKSAVIIHRPEATTTATDPYERAIALAHGYAIFDVDSGYVQLKTTGAVEPGPFAFSPVRGYVGIALRNQVSRAYTLDAVNLLSLVASPLSLMSEPLFLGPVPPAQGSSPYRIFVSQAHPAGRLSVINLDDRQVRTATGFTLNSEIE